MNYLEYTKDGKTYVKFSQSFNRMPRLLFVLFGQLEIYIHVTASLMYPYEVQLSESEFISCLELAKEL